MGFSWARPQSGPSPFQLVFTRKGQHTAITRPVFTKKTERLFKFFLVLLPLRFNTPDGLEHIHIYIYKYLKKAKFRDSKWDHVGKRFRFSHRKKLKTVPLLPCEKMAVFFCYDVFLSCLYLSILSESGRQRNPLIIYHIREIEKAFQHHLNSVRQASHPDLQLYADRWCSSGGFLTNPAPLFGKTEPQDYIRLVSAFYSARGAKYLW